MTKEELLKKLKTIMELVFPYILKLIQSYAVPVIKRKAYQKADAKIDSLIQDLAQNASKIADEKDETKKSAYIEGTRLGIDTLKAIAKKLNQAADEIEKVIPEGVD